MNTCFWGVVETGSAVSLLQELNNTSVNAANKTDAIEVFITFGGRGREKIKIQDSLSAGSGDHLLFLSQEQFQWFGN